MTKVQDSQKVAGKPQLNPKAVGGADVLVATVALVEFRKSQFRAEEQPVLTFEEFPNHELRLGKRSTARMCESFGDETDDWIGKRVPLVKAREEVGNQLYVVFQVAPVEEWKDVLARAKTATGGARKK